MSADPKTGAEGEGAAPPPGGVTGEPGTAAPAPSAAGAKGSPAPQGPPPAALKRQAPPKVGDVVFLRRALAGRGVKVQKARLRALSKEGVATVEVLVGEGVRSGEVVEGVRRYTRANAVGPTDPVCPSWVSDLRHVGRS